MKIDGKKCELGAYEVGTFHGEEARKNFHESMVAIVSFQTSHDLEWDEGELEAGDFYNGFLHAFCGEE